jgi:serine/threonine protein kinase
LGRLILDLWQGLKYLREKEVAHRDLKPANIFLSKGRAIIADFGLAKFYQYDVFDSANALRIWTSVHRIICPPKECCFTATRKKPTFGPLESLFTNSSMEKHLSLSVKQTLSCDTTFADPFLRINGGRMSTLT